MKATKKQIEQITKLALEMGCPINQALSTLNNCSLSIFKAIGAKGVVESAIRANSKHFVDTMQLAKKADSLGVAISELMTPEQKAANWVK